MSLTPIENNWVFPLVEASALATKAVDLRRLVPVITVGMLKLLRHLEG